MFWGVTTAELLLAFSGQMPGMLVNILQCVGQAVMTKVDPVQNISGAEAEKPCIRQIIESLWPAVSRVTHSLHHVKFTKPNFTTVVY